MSAAVPTATSNDAERVEELLGRRPQGAFTVVVRDAAGDPVVIRNAPLLDDGTPMPTLYWLVGDDVRREVGTLESTGAVRRAERELAAEDIAAAHDAYAAARDALIPADHDGPRPSGGVGGTRRGVKCLHAHYAAYLVDGTDPVGAWVHNALDEHQAPADGSTDPATSTDSASREQAGPAWPERPPEGVTAGPAWPERPPEGVRCP